MKTKIIIALTALLMLAGINANAQNGNQNPNTSPIIGDLNNDDKVDAADVVVLVKLINDLSNNVVLIANQIELISNESSLFAKADINLDGSINSADIDALVDQIMDEIKLAVGNVSNDTEYADILLLFTNGMYVTCNGKNENGYTVIHVNEISKDVADGITIIIDTNGYPLMASTPDGHFLFYNIEKDKSDFTFIRNLEDISFYKNTNIGFDIESLNSTRGIIKDWSKSFIDRYLGGWDEHSKKALPLYLMKVSSLVLAAYGAAVGGPVGWIGLLVAINNQLDINSGKNNKINFYADLGSLEISEFWSMYNDNKIGWWGILGNIIGQYADEELEKMGTFEPYIAPRFDGEEWQITIDPNTLVFPPEASYDVIKVHSKAKYEILRSKLDTWCEVTQYPNCDDILIRVKDNTEDDRSCYLYFYCPFTEDIKRVDYIIYQEGKKYQLSKKEIVFNPTHLNEKIYWNTTASKTYEEITCPKWCKVDKVNGGNFQLNITAEKSLSEAREGEIKIIAIIEGKKTQRTISVKQIPLCPDTNHPHMIDLGLPSGKKWSCCNAGASSPDKMGNYYSWGNHSPLSYTTGTYFDKDYPYKEWRDLDHDGKPSRTWDEWFIKLDEAYNSATSGSWGNGSMPSRDDCKELIENCERNQYIWTLGNQDGYYYTSKVNNNCIFIPYKSELYYWIYSTENNWAGIFNPRSGSPGGSLGDPEIISGNDRAKYCTGRPVRPVSK